MFLFSLLVGKKTNVERNFFFFSITSQVIRYESKMEILKIIATSIRKGEDRKINRACRNVCISHCSIGFNSFLSEEFSLTNINIVIR